MGTKSGLSDEKKEAVAKFLLRPFRLVRDPVHKDIWLTRLESTLVDQPLFQRLRGIRQLAVSHLVYPGALHTRFDHSIGTLFIADKITREAQKNCGSRGYLSDLNGFYQVREHDRLLIRLVALLHDVAHVPFGHLIEDEAGFTQDKQWADAGRMGYLKKELIEYGFNIFIRNLEEEFASEDNEDASEDNEDNKVKPAGSGECDSSCRNAFQKLIENLEGKNGTYSSKSAIDLINNYLFDDVLPELTSVLKAEEEGTSSIQKLNRPFVAEAVGDTICADLLDYLARDAYYTGLEERYDRRIFTYFTSFNNPDNKDKPHMGLLVKKGAKGVRVDAARYIAKLLDMRYALAQMVYTHPAKRMFSAFATSMFGSWVMYEIYKDNIRDSRAGGAGSARGGFSNIPGKVNELILKMVRDDKFNMDDALLSTLMNLDNEQPPLIDEYSSLKWGERTIALARAIKHRERWKRKRLLDFHTMFIEKTKSIESQYTSRDLKVTITTLSNLGGKGKIQIEAEVEGVLRKLFHLRFGDSREVKSLPAALFVLHVPKVFKPKEADVNVVLVHEDGSKRSAYAGRFKFLKKETLKEIKKIGEKGTVDQQNDLKEQTKSLEPMLEVLESTAKATVGLTVAEYYLHPKADELLGKIDVKAGETFTDMVALLVAFSRAPDSTGEDVLQEHYLKALEKLKDLAKAAGAKDVSQLENPKEPLAAHGGKSQTPTEIPSLADLFK